MMSDRIKTINELANRRQYFRIEDQASIELAVLEQHHSAAEYFDLNPEFGLISEFQLLDIESKHLMRTITDKDKTLGQLLKVLNKKLDSLSRVLALAKQPVSNSHIQEINLSEGGLAIKYPDLLQDDQLVAIKLILLPEYSGLLLSGTVLSCQGKQAPYDLHIKFSDISEAHQQLIARHIMRKQTHDMHPEEQ